MKFSEIMFYVFLINSFSFLCYGLDKFFAIKKMYRISEIFLLSLSIFGGSLGSILAMRLFRHKTRKWYFHFFNYIFLIFDLYVLVRCFL